MSHLEDGDEGWLTVERIVKQVYRRALLTFSKCEATDKRRIVTNTVLHAWTPLSSLAEVVSVNTVAAGVVGPEGSNSAWLPEFPEDDQEHLRKTLFS